MSVRVTHRRMSPGGWSNEHIIAVRWINDQNGAVGESTREIMVQWIAYQGGFAYVQGPSAWSQVGVVRASPPYLRTYADGIWNDNLLALPTF
jgi:hypothetical protein